MRHYQVCADKNIVDCIEKDVGNGYVGHTTESGKKLTSLKSSTLLKANPNFDKCLFVVAPRDLADPTNYIDVFRLACGTPTL
jgi:type I restriction enzyme R subunit